jgi:hypothetical protein
VGVTLLGGTDVDERELDRIVFEAGHDYNFRLAALVRQYREHRTMLRRYLAAQVTAAQAGTDQVPAAIQALLEAYKDAWELLGEPAPKTGPFAGVSLSNGYEHEGRLWDKSEPTAPWRGPDRRRSERRSQIRARPAWRASLG